MFVLTYFAKMESGGGCTGAVYARWPCWQHQWIMEVHVYVYVPCYIACIAALFCKPVQDRRVSPAMVSKGSIYAAVQQQDSSASASRVLNGNSTAAGDAGGGGHLMSNVLQAPSRLDVLPLNHRATPNSEDNSDPDAASNASFDYGNFGVSARVPAAVLILMWFIACVSN